MQWLFDLLGTLKDLLVAISAAVTVISFFVGWGVLMVGLLLSLKWVIAHL